VLLVDDSPVALALLRRALSTSPDIVVVGSASNGREALEMIPTLQPAVVCTDLHMPEMDGVELTRQIVSLYPRPVLVISTSTTESDQHNVFRLLEAGALDVLPKPISGRADDYQKMASELVSKIKILSGVYVFRRRVADPTQGKAPAAAHRAAGPTPRIIVIGASTGGPQSIREILLCLPFDFPIPVICVQHITNGFLPGLVEWLQVECRLTIGIASAGELPSAGKVYLPPENRHIEIGHDGRFQISDGDMVSGHRPSVTVTMRSAASYYRDGAVGVLLSGMGRDGADGMLAIARAGGTTIAQDERSSTVFGMPKQAIELGAAHYILNPGEIGRHLLTMVRSSSAGDVPSQ
jgi:two-component system chemotaxis response regulator CheB